MAPPIPSRRQSGYTLIELLVVMAIVGVLALAYGYYRQDRNGPAVKGTINALFGTLVDARTMARAVGVPVILTPTGTGSQAVLTYQPDPTLLANGPQGQFVFASDPSVARFCMVDMTGNTTAGSNALSDLKGDLAGDAVNGQSIFGATAWTKSVFDTSSTNKFEFNPNGSASTDAFVVVVAATNGTAQLSGPVGVILVNASGNIFRYYRSSSSSAWVRL